MEEIIEKIINKFNISGELIEVIENNTGNINNTYIAVFRTCDGEIKKYLIQKINTSVFTEPYKLMKNIEGVTSYLKRQLAKNEDDRHQVLEVVKTKDNKPLCFVLDNGERDY